MNHGSAPTTINRCLFQRYLSTPDGRGSGFEPHDTAPSRSVPSRTQRFNFATASRLTPTLRSGARGPMVRLALYTIRGSCGQGAMNAVARRLDDAPAEARHGRNRAMGELARPDHAGMGADFRRADDAVERARQRASMTGCSPS